MLGCNFALRDHGEDGLKLIGAHVRDKSIVAGLGEFHIAGGAIEVAIVGKMLSQEE